MSQIFTEEVIETLPEWNAVLNNGCCCALPLCPLPIRECQSAYRGRDSDHNADWQHMQELEAYHARRIAHEEWEAARDEWVAEEEGRDPEDFPTAEPVEAGEEPTPPEGYDEWTHGTWIQFSEPAGDLDDDLPFLYRRYKQGPWTQGGVPFDEFVPPGEFFTGSHGWSQKIAFYSDHPDGLYSSEFGHMDQTFTAGPEDSSTGTITLGEATFDDGSPLTCDDTSTIASNGTVPPGYDVTNPDGYPGYPAGEWPVSIAAAWVCTPTTQTYTGATRELIYGTEESVPSCPGPWGVGSSPPNSWVSTSWANLTAKYPDHANTFSDGISKATLRTETIALLPEWPEDPEDAEDDECGSLYLSDWPSKEDGMIPAIPAVEAVEADPEAEPPVEAVEAVEGVPAHWPVCDDPIHPQRYLARAAVRRVRYRWGVRSLIIYRADPDVPVDPEAPPVPDDGFPDPPPDGDLDPDPVHCWKGTYFKITWDILTEPLGWDDTVNDPEATPPDPLPEGTTLEEWWAEHQIPKPGRPLRTLEEDLVWEWTGPGDPRDAASWLSGWYALDPPEVPGEKRVVNVRYECYHSPYGNRPQVAGESVELPDA